MNLGWLPLPSAHEHGWFGRNAADTVERTIVCTDIVGFTHITEQLGDRGALEARRLLAKLVRQETRRLRGEELELQGDGFLLAFGKPLAGVLCAVSIQRALAREPIHGAESRLEIRIAVHTGPVLRDGDGYFGASVIVPYRLLERAGGGDIVVSSATRSRVDGQLRFGSSNAILAKGFSREIRYCGVEWSREDLDASAPRH